MGQLDMHVARSVADERLAEAMRLAEHRLRTAERLEGTAVPARPSRIKGVLERLHATRLAVRLHLIHARPAEAAAQ